MNAGDYFVVRTSGLAAWLIRAGCRSWANHAGVIVGEDGRTVEAKPSGAAYGSVHDYAHDRIRVGCPVLLDPDTRARIVARADALIGTPYSWLDILALALLQFGVSRPRWVSRRVARHDRLTCGELVDLAYHEAGVELFSDGRPPGDVTPAGLARLLPS